MINSLADILTAFLEQEKKTLEQYGDIGHPVMIGDMYEGLSRNLLSKAVFKDLDIRVVEGKIKNEKGVYSKQMDCLVVVGEGELIPYTNHYLYNYEQVIAVLESKKNLYASEIGDAYENLLSTQSVASYTNVEIPLNLIIRAFQYLTKVRFKRDISLHNEKEQLLYHALVVMHAEPLRIIFGYNGYKSQENFRKGFADYLESNLSTLDNKKKGYGVSSFPDLIVCDGYCLVKHNFQPFTTEQTGGVFPILSSGTKSPLYYLISMLWYKINLRFDLGSSTWDTDDELAVVNKFLSAKFDDNLKGWLYQETQLSNEELNLKHPKMYYEPLIVSKGVYIIAQILCENDEVDLLSIGVPNDELEELKNDLISTKLFEVSGNSVKLLTEGLGCVIMPEEGYVIGEDVDGSLQRWIFQNIKKK